MFPGDMSFVRKKKSLKLVEEITGWQDRMQSQQPFNFMIKVIKDFVFLIYKLYMKSNVILKFKILNDYRNEM